ncbi:MAG: SDR family oxidoreductase [Phycisphaerales bacterium]|nr:SDR family oxidoreductase [Phycisphaerales bacterium]
MTISTRNLILGGTGATGKLLVQQLLDQEHHVKVIVRTPGKLSEAILNHKNSEIVVGNVLDMSNTEIKEHVEGCTSIASCLGHSKIYSSRRRLVTDTATRLCDAINETNPSSPVRFILMNSTGCRNHDIPEKTSLGERFVVGLVRSLIPPHADNEAALEFFRSDVGQENSNIEWVIVRPDNLTNAETITPYDLYPSPIRSAIFNPGKTSRINVAAFFAELMTDNEMWIRWAGQMPVVYNCE